MWMLKDLFLFKNVSQTCCSHMKACPKSTSTWMDYSTRHWTCPINAPVSPFTSRDFSELWLFLWSAPLWFSIYVQALSLHLHIQSAKLKLHKLITSKTPHCGFVKHVSTEKQQTMVHFSSTGRQIRLACPEKLGAALHKEPRALAGGTTCPLVPTLCWWYICSLNAILRQGRRRQNMLHIDLAITSSCLIALSGWQSWQDIIDVETYPVSWYWHF